MVYFKYCPWPPWLSEGHSGHFQGHEDMAGVHLNLKVILNPKLWSEHNLQPSVLQVSKWGSVATNNAAFVHCLLSLLPSYSPHLPGEKS